MRVRSLFVAMIMVLTVLLAVPAAATGRGHWGGSPGSSGPPTIAGVIGEIADQKAKDPTALRYVGHKNRDFDGEYQKRDPFIVAHPADHPVEFVGSLDLSNVARGTVSAIGLVELADLESGGDARDTGALIYVDADRPDGSLRIGPSDGRDPHQAGEIVQHFIVFRAGDIPHEEIAVSFRIDPSANPSTCASDSEDAASATGCMTLMLGENPSIIDSYGAIKATIDTEFSDGSVPGWELLESEPSGVGYSFTISPAETLSVDDHDHHGKWQRKCRSSHYTSHHRSRSHNCGHDVHGKKHKHHHSRRSHRASSRSPWALRRSPWSWHSAHGLW